MTKKSAEHDKKHGPGDRASDAADLAERQRAARKAYRATHRAELTASMRAYRAARHDKIKPRPCGRPPKSAKPATPRPRVAARREPEPLPPQKKRKQAKQAAPIFVHTQTQSAEKMAAPERRPGAGGYEAHRDNMGWRSREQSGSARDIGAIPEPLDPDRRARGLNSLREFCDIYFAERFYLEWSPDHLNIIQKMQHVIMGGELFALAMPRGSGKTSLVVVACIWAMLKGLRKFVAIIAATTGKGILILDSIKRELATNQMLFEDFPELCFPIWKLEGVNQRAATQMCEGRPTAMSWQARKLVLPTVSNSAASGGIISVAGLKSGDILGLQHTVSRDDGTTAVIRPELVILDDPQTPESARSVAQVSQRESILHGAVLGLAGPTRRITAFALLTVIAPHDLADNILSREKHPMWQGERYKMLKTLPTNEALWSEYYKHLVDGTMLGKGVKLATEFYGKHRAKMDVGAEATWAARFEPDELSAIQSAMNLKFRNEQAFWSEYQNEPMVRAELALLATPDEIAARVSGYPQYTAPAWATELTAFIDIHDNVLFYAVVAWAPDFSGHILDYGTYPDQNMARFTQRGITRTLARAKPGAGKEGAVVAGLEQVDKTVIGRIYPRADGMDMRVSLCLVDANYMRDIVVDFVRRSNRLNLLPSFGRSIGPGRKPMADYKKHPGDRLSAHWMITRSKRDRVRHILNDVNYWKGFVHARLGVAQGDPGALTLWGKDKRAHRLLAEHLTAEVPVETSGPWGTVQEWHARPESPDNHWFDCVVGCAAGASTLGMRLPGTSLDDQRPKKRVRVADLLAARGRA